MKVAISLFLICIFCFITIPVDASSFGLSPAVANAQIIAGQSTDISFTVSGFSGVVEISVEGLPAVIAPRAVDVTDGSKINLTLSCSADVSSGEHKGTLLFVAKSGSNVQAGIRIPCTLNVHGGSQNVNASGAPIVPDVAYTNPGTPPNKTGFVLVLSIIAILIILGMLYYWRKSGA